MKLDRFILNTDYDTMKETNSVTGSVTVASATLQRGESKSAYSDITVSSGAYLELQSVTMSVASGSNFCSANGYYEGSDEVQYRYNIKRQSSTKYRIEAEVINLASDFGQRTTQSLTVNVKLHLFIPSTQQ